MNIQAQTIPAVRQPHKVEIIEDTQRGGYSRIADDVRRNAQRVRFLQKITVSQNAPEWRRHAAVVQRTQILGVHTVLLYDTGNYSEVWYKTGTKANKPCVWVR